MCRKRGDGYQEIGLCSLQYFKYVMDMCVCACVCVCMCSSELEVSLWVGAFDNTLNACPIAI